nr:MAG: capsid protein [Chemarfal virus 41]
MNKTLNKRFEELQKQLNKMKTQKRGSKPKSQQNSQNQRARRLRGVRNRAVVVDSFYPSVYHQVTTAKSGSVVIEGVERLPALSNYVSLDSITPGDVIAAIELAPQAFPDCWLQRQAMLYEKFRFLQAELIVCPNCSTLSEGSLLYCYEPDAWDDPPTSLVVASSYPGTKVSQLSMRVNVPFPVNDTPNMAYFTDPLVYTEASYKSSSQGTIMALWNAKPAAAGTPLPTLFLRYRVQFWHPNIQQDFAVAPNASVNLGSDASGTVLLSGITGALLTAAGIKTSLGDYGTSKAGIGYLEPNVTTTNPDRVIKSGLVPGQTYPVQFIETGAGTNSYNGFLAETLEGLIGRNYLPSTAAGLVGLAVNAYFRNVKNA